VAHQREETSDGESFVAVAQDLEVYGFVIVQITQERNDGVYRYHEQDAYDAATVSRVLASSGVARTASVRMVSDSASHAAG
jgi:hypothetical protein